MRLLPQADDGPSMPPRLIHTGLEAPARASAIDEAVLDSVVSGDAPATLHVYRRSEPTVSLGRFLAVDDACDPDYCQEHGVQIVRRISAGGAIYTDPSVVLFGLADPSLGTSPERILETAGTAIAETVREGTGADARFVPDNDVHVGDRKVCGMAVAIRRNVGLLHGAFIVDLDLESTAGSLGQDPREIAQRVAGLNELLDRAIAVDDVVSMIVDALSGILDEAPVARPLTETEEARVRELVDGRYGDDGWNLRR